MTTRRAPLSITVSQSERALIHAIAVAHERTVSDTMRLLAHREAERLGIVVEQKEKPAPPGRKRRQS